MPTLSQEITFFVLPLAVFLAVPLIIYVVKVKPNKKVGVALLVLSGVMEILGFSGYPFMIMVGVLTFVVSLIFLPRRR
ncbi:hypothetical protein [Sulfuracidifex tepidarius]|nr:hypothetical protein [Sulfuracidifex tepidarius]